MPNINQLLVRWIATLFMCYFIFLNPITVRAQYLVQLRGTKCLSIDYGMRRCFIFLSPTSVYMVKLQNAVVGNSASPASIAILRKDFPFQLSGQFFEFFVMAQPAPRWIPNRNSFRANPLLKEELFQPLAFPAPSALVGLFVCVLFPERSEFACVPTNESCRTPSSARTMRWQVFATSALTLFHRGREFNGFHACNLADYMRIGKVVVLDSAYV